MSIVPKLCEYLLILRPHCVVTSTPATTVTPATKSFTSTAIVTSTLTSNVPQVTDTATVVVFQTAISTTTLPTQTLTAFTSSIVYSTTTLQGTFTVASPAGFTPVLNTLPGSAARKKRSAHGGSLLAAVAARGSRKAVCPQLPGKGKPLPHSYPDFVKCVGIVEVVTYKTTTKTAKITTTVKAPTPSTTLTTTATLVVTSALNTPDASTTVTATSTVEILATSAPITT